MREQPPTIGKKRTLNRKTKEKNHFLFESFRSLSHVFIEETAEEQNRNGHHAFASNHWTHTRCPGGAHSCQFRGHMGRSIRRLSSHSHHDLAYSQSQGCNGPRLDAASFRTGESPAAISMLTRWHFCLDDGSLYLPFCIHRFCGYQSVQMQRSCLRS